MPGWVQEGEGVTVTSTTGPSKTGVVRFVGPVTFAPGNWVGVELDQPEGRLWVGEGGGGGGGGGKVKVIQTGV